MSQTTTSPDAPPEAEAPLMLSISGLRGLIGRSLTPPVAARYGAAFGSWLCSTLPSGETCHVIVGRDSRPSGPMIEDAAVAGLLATGCRVTRLGIASTPGTAIMVQRHRAHGGLVITASHNPIIWNGLKALRHDGVAPPSDQAQQILDRYHNQAFDYVGVDGLQPSLSDDTTTAVHTELVLPLADVAAVRQAKLKVVLDSVHGAGGKEGRTLLDGLGVEVVHLYAEPTGQFPHEPEPLAKNLTGLCEAVREHGAHVGFAQDPDADRLAIVDERGAYIGEEYTLALCALHKLGQGDVAVANLSTSRMLDDIAEQAGARVHRTPVGEANVAAGIRETGALLGGEGNGGIIWPTISQVRDSLVGMALVLEMLAKRGKPLSAVAGAIPRYAIVKDKVPVDPAVVAVLPERMREYFAEQRIDVRDGVRVDWADRWVHVRPSNTEPILRLIAEAKDETAAQALIAAARQALGLVQTSAGNPRAR